MNCDHSEEVRRFAVQCWRLQIDATIKALRDGKLIVPDHPDLLTDVFDCHPDYLVSQLISNSPIRNGCPACAYAAAMVEMATKGIPGRGGRP